MASDYTDAAELLTPAEVVDKVCAILDIPPSREDMTDTEITEICNFIGKSCPSDSCVDGERVISVDGFNTILFILSVEFPDYYERHNLSVVWLN